MPLDDNEQKILAEIERRFYEEDPELARAVKGVDQPSKMRLRLAAVGVVAGLATILVFFATNTIIALVGFAVLLTSATILAPEIKRRVSPPDPKSEDPEQDF